MCICRLFGKVTRDVVNVRRQWLKKRNQTLAQDPAVARIWFEFEVLTWPQIIIQSGVWTEMDMLGIAAHLQGSSRVHTSMSWGWFGSKVGQRNIRQVALSLVYERCKHCGLCFGCLPQL